MTPPSRCHPDTLKLHSRRSPDRKSLFLIFIFISGVLATLLAIFLRDWTPIDRNNIGNVKSSDFLSYGPIDVVYTWVNGTDPRWKTEKEYWHKHWIASLTGQPLPVWGQETDVKGKDDSNSDNRFRDNEELRYSLRSLEKYAPWIRHVYIVTDGQIPSWLDIESPKISIVKHENIFVNKSHLPVFSSPAIEWTLDNIPGLSDMFLYFNDDVFLGSAVRPEDFVSQAGVQKTYLAWEIPLCANNCWETSLANGKCNKECNVTACDFDMGDCGCDVNPLDGTLTCDAEKIATILKNDLPKQPDVGDGYCQGMCMYEWLGNGVCDRVCNVSSCAFDGGDCRVKDVYGTYRSRVYSGDGENDEEDDEEDEEDEEDGLSPLVKELWSADVAANHTLVKVPLNVNASYLNLTDAFGVNGSICTAAHDNDKLIRFASVHEAEMVLLLVFGRNRAKEPMTSSAQISVVGEDAEGHSIHMKLSIVRGNDQIEELPRSLATTAISGGMFTFQHTSIWPDHRSLPFGFEQAAFRVVFPSDSKNVEHATTTEDDEKVFIDSLVEDNYAGVAAKLSGRLPLAEIFLPFDVLKKQLSNGDILNLGWHMDLHLRNDETDIDWSDQNVCQVQVSKKRPVVSSMDPTAVHRGERKNEAAVDDSRQDSSIGGTRTEGDVVPVTGTSSEAMNAEKSFEQKSAKQNSGPNEVKLGENAGVEELEKDNGFAKCHLNEEKSGIVVTIRVLPNYLYTVFPAATGSGLDGKNVETGSSQIAESSSTNDDATSVNSNLDKLMKEQKMRPHVTDGQICFFDMDRVGVSRYRYCFAIAMGHFHAKEVEVVHKPTLRALLHPPKMEVVYTPYMGDDPALLELFDRCIDATIRFIGMRPQLCYLSEMPAPRPSLENEATADIPQQQEEDGRRLACDAQKQRLAHRDERERKEREASSGVFSSLSRFIRNIKLAVGFEHVVPANDSLDYIEYADVCTLPGPVSAEKKPEVTVEDVQTHLSKDTFGDSLRYVNKLYNRVFGKPETFDRRRVPSHMPFLLQKSIIREIKDYWVKEVQETSAHRFRHPQDMQFSFSYFHYLINRAKIHPHTLEEIWREYLDVNRNGILDENEVLTAASLAYGDAPPEDFVTEMRKCIDSEKRVKVREIPTAEGTLRLSETLTPHITMENLERCPKVRDALVNNVRHESKVELMSETEVTFHMLSEDYKFAWKQMMGTRARRTKFVCINDDMKFPSTAVSQILHELFLSIWPERSQFELPYHLKNRYAHIDEYNAAQERRQIAVWIALLILLLVAFVFRAELRAVYGIQDIVWAQVAADFQPAQDCQQTQEQDKTHLASDTNDEKDVQKPHKDLTTKQMMYEVDTQKT